MSVIEHRFGPYGGQYVPETLMPALAELEAAWDGAWADDGFREDPLGTSGRCFEVQNYEPTETNRRIVCWNFQNGRTLKVNGTSVACLTGAGVALGEPRAGGYCVQVGSGQASYAGILLPTK